MKQGPHPFRLAETGSTEVSLLRTFLSSPSEFRSGEVLARQHGISRVAVWKRIESLKSDGYSFEAARRKGYRLSNPPPRPTAAGILARMDPALALRAVRLFASHPSTNEAALRLLAEGAEAPFACVTRIQPGGKGRRGRSWAGATEGNVYATVAFRPEASPQSMALLPIRAGLNLCRRLSVETGLALRMKWPNDLLLDDRKAAGMLAESTIETDRVTALVFGLGLNVNLSREEIPSELRDKATSLAIAAGKLLDLERITAAALEEILRAGRECAAGVDEDRLADDWDSFAAYRNEAVEILSPDGPKTAGVLTGIDRSGSLLLRTHEGALRSFRAGDVSLRSDSGARKR